MQLYYIYIHILIYKISNTKNKTWKNEWADVARLLASRSCMGIMSVSAHQHKIEQIKWQ